VSPILAPAIAEIKREHPGVVVGTIGDEVHAREESDHNPDEWGFVCAADVMIGKAFTAADAAWLFDRLAVMIRAGFNRIAYVIYNRHIVSSTVQPGVVRAYTEDDPHTNHLHLSVVHGSRPHPTSSWGIYTEADMNEASIAQKLGGDLNNDASGIAKGARHQVDTAVADNFAAINARLDAQNAKIDEVLAYLTVRGAQG
jgi:hypothetical protein